LNHSLIEDTERDIRGDGGLRGAEISESDSTVTGLSNQVDDILNRLSIGGIVDGKN
jgi:hypothetical protein